MAKSLGSDYMMPHKSPMEKYQSNPSAIPDSPSQIVKDSSVLRGWLNMEQTDVLLAMLEQDDCSLHAVLLAAGLLALTRTVRFQNEEERIVKSLPGCSSSQVQSTEPHYSSIR